MNPGSISKLHSLTAAAILALQAVSLYPQTSMAQGKAKAALTPMQLVQSGRYTQALPGFKAMAAAEPRDLSVQYYLGLCAESAHDYNLAELAYSKVVIGSRKNTAFALASLKRLASLPSRAQPQSALQNDKTHRWDPKANPIRIFIADGRALPAAQSGGVMSRENYKMAQTIVQTALARQPVTPSYKYNYAQYVKSGISAWDWAMREKLLSYTFVTDPRRADIAILFCERCNGGEDGYALYPYEWKQPELIFVACEKFKEMPQDEAQKDMVKVVAHEFGHCLGLEHSDIPTDIMNVHCAGEAAARPDQLCSVNDKATLRALYSMPADINFVSIE